MAPSVGRFGRDFIAHPNLTIAVYVNRGFVAGQRSHGDFRERAANAGNDFETGDVVEQETGIEIPEVPEQCQQSTKDTRQALVDAESNLQNQLTFAAWLEEQLAAASAMNADECDDLAESYETIIADGAALITASQDRQTALKADAFLIKGEDGETFAEFQMRFKNAFTTYVPIPITPDVAFTPLPGTCQQSTRDARAEL